MITIFNYHLISYILSVLASLINYIFPAKTKQEKTKQKPPNFNENFEIPENPPSFMKVYDNISCGYYYPIISLNCDPFFIDYLKQETKNFEFSTHFTIRGFETSYYSIMHFYRFSPLTPEEFDYLAKSAMCFILEFHKRLCSHLNIKITNDIGLLLGGVILDYAKNHGAEEKIINYIRELARYLILTFNFWTLNPFDESVVSPTRILFKTGELILWGRNGPKEGFPEKYEILRKFEPEIEEKFQKQTFKPSRYIDK